MAASRPRINAFAIGAGFVVALAVVIASHRFQLKGFSPLGGEALRSLHGTGFVAIAIAVYLGLRGRLSGWRRIGAAFLVCAAISVLAELSQVPGPRNAELADLITDGMGIVAGLGLVAAFDKSVHFGAAPWPRRLVAVAAAIALAYVVAPTLWLTSAVAARKANLPVLLSFESILEREIYAVMGPSAPERVPAPAGWPAHGDTIGHGTARGRWGTMLQMAPYSDWRGYEGVSFVVATTTDTPLDIGVRVRGNFAYYERFRTGPEPARVRIAFDDIRAKRPDFDFSRISALVVSAAEPGEPYEVLFDDFRLETQDSR